MKKTVVNIVVTIVAIAIVAICVGCAVGEVERDKERRIYEMNEKINMIVSIDNFFAHGDLRYGDYYIEAKGMILPYHTCIGWYEISSIRDGAKTVIMSDWYSGYYYDEGAYEFNERWDNALLMISYATDGWA